MTILSNFWNGFTGFWQHVLSDMLSVSDFIWSFPILVLTVVVAVTLTIGTGFFQFRYFGHAMKNTFGKMFKTKGSEKGISSLAAVCSALASTLGVGNIAGVAVAIALGGPGAVFWMWLVALFGLIVKYAEVCLAVKYREVDPETGMYKGGIMYYAKKGLGKKFAWMGGLWCFVIFAVQILAPAVQINSLTGSLTAYFDINPVIIGVVCAVIMGFVLIGGLKRISKCAEIVVPFMALAYCVVAIFVIITHITAVPAAFGAIFAGAFSGTAATGGFLGAGVSSAIRWGLARGVYSNEAGNGTAALVHATANVDHPAKQGIWGITEVFVDTIIVCTMTALVIMVTGVWTSGQSGAALTTMGFAAGMGSETAAGIFVSLIIFFFAFTTAVVSVYYGENCLGYFTKNKTAIMCYRILACIMAIVGAVGGLSTIWGLADLGLGIANITNLCVLFGLRKDVFKITAEYKDMIKKGEV